MKRNEIRDLLEANLLALHALAKHQAHWNKSLAETRALLYVALRELIVSNDNERTVVTTLVANDNERPRA